MGVETDAQLDNKDGGEDVIDQISVQRELSVVDPVAVLVQGGPVLGQQARQHKGLPAHRRVSFSADFAADADDPCWTIRQERMKVCRKPKPAFGKRPV